MNLKLKFGNATKMTEILLNITSDKNFGILQEGQMIHADLPTFDVRNIIYYTFFFSPHWIIFMTYTTIQKTGVGKIFYVFERSLLCSLRLPLFDHKYRTNSNTFKYYYNLKCFYFNIF